MLKNIKKNTSEKHYLRPNTSLMKLTIHHTSIHHEVMPPILKVHMKKKISSCNLLFLLWPVLDKRSLWALKGQEALEG